MSKEKGILSAGWSMVGHNKRYIFWFWLLNLTLAEFGTGAFRRSAHAILDKSLYSDRLVHGFDLGVAMEMFSRPEFGSISAAQMPAAYFAFLFFVATALFLPGVFAGYASNYRLPRDEFFRACGRNLWRFIRLMLVAGVVMGIVAGLLFTLHGVLERKAGESTNELLLPEMRYTGLAVIFLIMACFRIWFDLAEADVVLNDQRAVRKSIRAGLVNTWRSLFRLLSSYVLTTIIAAVVLIGGILAWMRFVSPENIVGAFLMAQLTMLLLLVPRFWQRGVAVAYWQQKMAAPVGVFHIAPQAIPLPVAPVAAQTVASSSAAESVAIVSPTPGHESGEIPA